MDFTVVLSLIPNLSKALEAIFASGPLGTVSVFWTIQTIATFFIIRGLVKRLDDVQDARDADLERFDLKRDSYDNTIVEIVHQYAKDSGSMATTIDKISEVLKAIRTNSGSN